MTMRGYILRTIDYRDTSKLLYAYTEEGVKSMIARGVKKMDSPLRHMSQSGMLLDMELSESRLPTLKDAVLIDHFPKIKESFEKTTVLSCINELVYHNVGENDNHPKLMTFLDKFVETLKQTKAPFELLLVFELKFLWFLGAGIHMKNCYVCQSVEALRFDQNQSAVVCQKHLENAHTHYGADIVNALRYFYYLDIRSFKPLGLKKSALSTLYAITDELYAEHLGFRGKAKTILKSLF